MFEWVLNTVLGLILLTRPCENKSLAIDIEMEGNIIMVSKSLCETANDEKKLKVCLVL